MLPGQFVADKTLRTQVLVGGRIQIHLAHGGIAETFTDGGFQLTICNRSEDKSCLWNPLTACYRVIIPSDACINGEPSGEVVTNVGINGSFIILGQTGEFIGGIHHVTRFSIGIPGMSVYALVIGSQGHISALP